MTRCLETPSNFRSFSLTSRDIISPKLLRMYWLIHDSKETYSSSYLQRIEEQSLIPFCHTGSGFLTSSGLE